MWDQDRVNAVMVDFDALTMGPNGRDPLDMAQAMADKPNERICQVVRALSLSMAVIIISDREVRHRAVTQKWLNLHYIKYNRIYMRPEGSDLPAADVKETLYLNEILPYYRVLLAIEDNPDGLLVSKKHDLNTVATVK